MLAHFTSLVLLILKVFDRMLAHFTSLVLLILKVFDRIR